MIDPKDDPFFDGVEQEQQPVVSSEETIPPIAPLTTQDFKKPRRQKLAEVDLSKSDRQPPSSEISEQGVLGSILLSPEECLPVVRQKLRPDAWYDLRHQALFEQMCAMEDARQPLTLITIQQWLKDRQMLDGIGGLAYLSSLMDAVPSAANLAYYVDIVREKHVLRNLLAVCTNTLGRVHSFEGEVDQLMAEVEQAILAASDDRMDELRTMKELARSFVDRMGDLHAGKVERGINTGIHGLDQKMQGMHRKELIVLAARPSEGKTSIAMSIALTIAQALPAGQAVGIQSYEMTADGLTERGVSCLGRLNLRHLRDFNEGDLKAMTLAAARFARLPIRIEDQRKDINGLCSSIRRMVRRDGVQVVFIDHLGKIKSRDTKAAQFNRQAEVGHITGRLADLAKELDIPIILLCQLNRDTDRQPRPPRLSDLRESGDIEQDADVVIFIHREKDDQTAHLPTIDLHLLILKQRNGPTGRVPVRFNRAYSEFVDRTIEDSDMVLPLDEKPVIHPPVQTGFVMPLHEQSKTN